MARTGMRLMSLDGKNVGMGWAAYDARLHDQVFLIPGCTVPVILRQGQDGTYQLIGDAQIHGADRVWEETRVRGLKTIKIV